MKKLVTHSSTHSPHDNLGSDLYDNKDLTTEGSLCPERTWPERPVRVYLNFLQIYHFCVLSVLIRRGFV